MLSSPKRVYSSNKLIENLPVDFIIKNAIISEIEVLKNKKLTIIEEEGNLFPKDQKKITINPRGIQTSKRCQNDGACYFGYDLEFEGNIINDFILNNEEKPNDQENQLKNLFCVFYFRETNSYFLRNMNNLPKYFIYSKIEKNLILVDKELLIVGGENFIDLEVQENLGLKVIYGNNKNKITTNFHNKQKILIGRKKECSIVFDESCFSRIHITIRFDDVKDKWIIEDGNEGHLSTNGIWILKENYEVQGNMVFKIDKSLFRFILE